MNTMKRAVVIGASSGIGLAVARLLLRDGWQLGIAARREDRLLALKREAEEEAGKYMMERNDHADDHVAETVGAERDMSSRVTIECIDVTADDATTKLRSLISRLGGMDLFFYASGIGKQNRTLTEGIELATVQTNALGFTRMVGEAFRYFAEQGRGHIAAITSIAGTKGLGPAPAYSATKAMQNTYLQALEQQAHARYLNIRITDLRPGFVDTDLLAGNFHYPMMMRPERVAQEILRAIHRREHVRVIDWRYRLLTAAWRCLPRWLWRRLPL